MKLIRSMLVCALATGLMTVATQKVQAAGLVIGNVIYVPLTISVTATYQVDDRNKKAKITEADIYTALGLGAKTTTLYVATDTGDIWAYDKPTKSLVLDLTTGGYFTITNSQTGSSSKGTTTTESGVMVMGIYSDPVLDSPGVVDVADSEAESSDWIELSGNYTLKKTDGAEKKGVSKDSDEYSAKDLTGSFHADEIAN